MKLATKVSIPGLIGVTYFLFTSVGAHAELLFSKTITNGFGLSSIASRVNITVSYMSGSTNLFTLFDSASWGVSDVGTTRILTQATDPDFNGFVGWLTDGTLESIEFWVRLPLGGGAGYGSTEPRIIYGSPTDPRIDLKGYRIDDISLYLNSLTINSPGSDPNGDGKWTDVRATFTFSANGELVPEPSSAVLTILSAGVLFAALRRHPAQRA